MKKSVCIIVLSLVYVLAFVSCEREQYSTEEGNKVETVSEGQINLSSLKLTVNVNANAATRADIDTKNYIIRIYNRDNDNNLVQEWKYSEMPEIFSLKVGNYTVAAFSHDVLPAEFEHPYYYGKEDFEILKDQITDIIDLQCVLRSVMVTVEYDEKLLTLLGNDVKANVTLGQGSLDFVKDETRAGYYQAINENANVITTRLTGTVEGESVDISKGFPQVKAGAHKIIRYTLKDVDENGSSEGGNADISIRIDVTCTTVEQDIIVDPDEDIVPDEPDEPDNPDMPVDPNDPNRPVSPGTPDNPVNPGNPDNPVAPGNPDNPVAPGRPDGNALPQSGQLNWPIPFMACSGVLLFAVGWVLDRKETLA